MNLRQVTKRLVTTLCLATLAGCAPMVLEYYKASADGGKLVGPSSCNRWMGPRTAILFEDQGLTLLVLARENMILLTITVPDGATARFLSDKLELRPPGDAPPVTLTIPQINYNHYRDIETKAVYEQHSMAPTEPMIGKDYRLSWILTQSRSHGANLIVPGGLPETFELRLPVLRFEESEIVYPPIRFKRSKGFGIYSVNC